ncbi:MAG: PH domain-containing protein [Archaeoglobaceae archaeon]
MILYEDKPKYDNWAKIMLSFAPSLMLLLIILIEYDLLPTESEEEAMFAKQILFASIAIILILYWAILPRRFEIHEDKLKIIFGFFTYSIPLQDVAEVRRAESWKAFAYKGLRFTTSIGNIVEIRKKKGISIVISPSNPDLFIEFLTNALKRERKAQK